MYYNNVGYEQAGEHINQTMWAYSGAPCNTYWVEQGLTQGYHGEVAYEWYLAFNQTNGNYQDFREGYTSPDGSTHSYWLNYAGSAAYYVIRDGTTLAFVGNLGYGTCSAQAGLEISADFNGIVSAHADTFDDVPLAWYDTSWALHYGWNPGQYWIDLPCGQGYSPPACFNGAWYGSTHWANNKP